MPQPPLQVVEYLETPLPSLREAYPPGTGGTGPRSEWPEGTLQSVEVIQDFQQGVEKYLQTVTTEPISPHPAHKYPKFIQAITTVPSTLKSPTDLQKCLKTLPLAAVSSVLTALEADAVGAHVGPSGAEALDKAGYESDGGEEMDSVPKDDGRTKAWDWQFSKSPMGSGEFLLMQQGSEDVHLVVRTINSSAFTSHDWEEYVVTGPYRYNTKSKASWYWSRTWGACNRLKCKYWVLTDWQRWAFGAFDEGKEHGWVSPIIPYSAEGPSILQILFYWARSATGDSKGWKPSLSGPQAQTASSGTGGVFQDNPARRVSVSGQKKPRVPADTRKVKTANESDIEESDAEDA